VSKQLFLKLVQPVAPNSVNAIRVQYESIYFDFAGRVHIPDNRRKGQFQYRYGVKVQPPDEKLYGTTTHNKSNNSTTARNKTQATLI
jgi:hypothetical protein